MRTICGRKRSTRTQTQHADANDERGRKADGTRTQTPEQPSAADPLAGKGFLPTADGADGADANLATSLPLTDFDAVLEERAAQGKPTNGYRPPRGVGWHGIHLRPRP